MSTSAQPLAFAAALSTQLDTTAAAVEACAAARKSLEGTPDLAVVFFSREHAGKADMLAQQLCEGARYGQRDWLQRRVDRRRRTGSGRRAGALRLAGQVAGCDDSLVQFEFRADPEGGVIQGWPDDLSGDWPEGSFLMLLGEPYSFPADALLERLNEDRSGVAVVGGMASGRTDSRRKPLILGRKSVAEGAAAATHQRTGRLRTIVSRGAAQSAGTSS